MSATFFCTPKEKKAIELHSCTKSLKLCTIKTNLIQHSCVMNTSFIALLFTDLFS